MLYASVRNVSMRVEGWEMFSHIFLKCFLRTQSKIVTLCSAPANDVTTSASFNFTTTVLVFKVIRVLVRLRPIFLV